MSPNDIDLRMDTFEFQRLKELATFITEIWEENPSLLGKPQYFVLDNSLYLSHNSYSSKNKDNYYLGFGHMLRQSPEYSIEELKAIVAHELGHILKNHLEITASIINILNQVSSFSFLTYLSGTAEILELLTAAYLRNLEREANTEAIRMYPNPYAHISATEKLEKNRDTFLPLLEQHIIDLYLSIKQRLVPIPDEYTSTHPSVAETISFFKQHITEDSCAFDGEKASQCSI